ncbi:MAG: hypothetical protein EB127_16995 [Alphaproteobacteria bacterium]|nr:hypothetical protein [Alphaproteobacteria bacterium]
MGEHSTVSARPLFKLGAFNKTPKVFTGYTHTANSTLNPLNNANGMYVGNSLEGTTIITNYFPNTRNHKITIIVPDAAAERVGMLSTSEKGVKAIDSITTLNEHSKSKITPLTFFCDKLKGYLQDTYQYAITSTTRVINPNILQFDVEKVKHIQNGELKTPVVYIQVMRREINKEFVITLERMSDDVGEFKKVCEILKNYLLPNAGQGGRRKQRTQRTHRKRSYRKIKSRRSRT